MRLPERLLEVVLILGVDFEQVFVWGVGMEQRLGDGTLVSEWVAKSDSRRREREGAAAQAEFSRLHAAVERATGRRIPARVLLDAVNEARSKQQAVPESSPEPAPRQAIKTDHVIGSEQEERAVEDAELSGLPAGIDDLIAASGQAPHLRDDAAAYVRERQAERDRLRRADSARREFEGRFLDAIRSGDAATIADVEREFQRKVGNK